MLDLPSDFRVLMSTITVTLTHHGSTTQPPEFYCCCQLLPHLRTRARSQKMRETETSGAGQTD